MHMKPPWLPRQCTYIWVIFRVISSSLHIPPPRREARADGVSARLGLARLDSKSAGRAPRHGQTKRDQRPGFPPESADAAVTRRITRHTYTRSTTLAPLSHHSRTHVHAHMRAKMSRTEPLSLSGHGAWHRRVGCASQPGCYYRRVPTTSSARPTSTIVCTYIHRHSPPFSPPSASPYLFISVYFTSPRRFPCRASLPSTSRRAPCDPDCYTTLRPGSISTTTNPSS